MKYKKTYSLLGILIFVSLISLWLIAKPQTVLAASTNVVVNITYVPADCATNSADCTPQPLPAPTVSRTVQNSRTATLTPVNGGATIKLDLSSYPETSATATINVTNMITYTLAVTFETFNPDGSVNDKYDIAADEQTLYTFENPVPTTTDIPIILGADVDGQPPASLASSTSGSTSNGAGCTGNACQGQVVVCNATFLNPISWFVCPVISSIQDIMASVGSTITSYLTIPSSYFNTSSAAGAPLYAAWDNIRDIALSLLALIALVMIFFSGNLIRPI